MVWDYYAPFADLRAGDQRSNNSNNHSKEEDNHHHDENPKFVIDKDEWYDEPPPPSSLQQQQYSNRRSNYCWKCCNGIRSCCCFGDCFGRTRSKDDDDDDDDDDDARQRPLSSSSSQPVTTKIRIQLYAFFTMALPYFQESWKGCCLFIGLLLLMILNSGIRVFFSFLARDFWSALADGNQEQFYAIIQEFLFCMLLLAPITVFYKFQRQRLAISWREWMTYRVLELYSSNRVYYSLERNMNTTTNNNSTAKTKAIPTKNGIPTKTSSNSTLPPTTTATPQPPPPTTYNTFFQGMSYQSQDHEKQQTVNDSSTKTSTSTSTTTTTIMDNPDQRIAEDVKSFTEYSLQLFLTISVSCIDLIAFSIILYMIEPKLFISIIIFAGLGTLTTIIIGKTLIYLNFERLHREADFRFSLVRLRENAESIAFFTGENMEGKQIISRFRKVIRNAKYIIGTQRNLDFFTTLYTYMTWIWPIVVVAPNYFAGTVEIGVVQQAAAAFGHVLEDLSVIITEFESLSEFSASIDRLYQFISAIREADPDRNNTVPLMTLNSLSPSSSSSDTVRTTKPSRTKLARSGLENDNEDNNSPDEEQLNVYQSADVISTPSQPLIELCPLPPMTGGGYQEHSSSFSTMPPSSFSSMALSLRNLTLLTPDYGRTLVRNLNVQLPWGQQLLIVGPSGVGKSSLLRAIAGLWTAGSGSIVRPDTQDVYFLPQKPYCPLGTLRDQLLYPYIANKGSTTITKNNEKYDAQGLKTNKDGKLSSTSVTSTSNATASIGTTAATTPNHPTTLLPIMDEQLLQILQDIDLLHLANRVGNGNALSGLDTILDWSNILSLGEQQRLAFGRVLLHQPSLVILDESTSAMDVASETKMYTLLAAAGGGARARGHDHRRSDGDGDGGCKITYISVGHRPTLLSHHDIRLEIKNVDNYSVDPILKE